MEAIDRYERAREQHLRVVASAMSEADYARRNEIVFSCHSCAIEGNTFSVDDTRELKERGLAMVTQGKTLLEAFEMLDHFGAYEYICANLGRPMDEEMVRETNRRVMEHTMAYRAPGSRPGEYTDTDMAAGDTVFGDHRELIARLPLLLHSTAQALARGMHPLTVAARFHGFFVYLHPFRDGNGRTARLLSNHILMSHGHPPLVIPGEARGEYIAALRQIRTEGTDEHLQSFFIATVTSRLEEEIRQKEANTRRLRGVFF